MKVNGRKEKIGGQMTLKAYLEENGYSIARIAVERNGEIVPKSMYEECVLSDNDTLEVVHFVGGG